MPINIVDVSTFTDPVVAPSGGDVRNSASVRQPIQHLANRARYLYNLFQGKIDRTWACDVFSAYPGANWSFSGTPTTGPVWVATTTGATNLLFIPIPKLPPGSQIVSVAAKVNTDAARLLANRLEVQLLSCGPADAIGGGTLHGTAQADDGTDSVQTVTQTLASPLTIDDARVYYVRVKSGTLGASTGDFVGAAQVTFKDPTAGPGTRV